MKFDDELFHMLNTPGVGADSQGLHPRDKELFNSLGNVAKLLSKSLACLELVPGFKVPYFGIHWSRFVPT
jgi:hypothetical protein